ncbi:uncharacterized protein DUF2236 [Rathayibacter sp. PhB93]|uniref:oxygenase MpaB family protein n=1 Tax=unclassified Rathayibacter TaxID=2609250 RepID=UPI000F4810F8|nr:MULTISPECIES: oxygenase MpaB family protein [unclassified Rathayibacter]ROQ04629.1 uncharacterized protein DUF2236 [Rathayibacter sp. PhB93]TDQ13467.1 uncharacterized protein DUF2236 [Rathayibacter sp. PhB1]
MPKKTKTWLGTTDRYARLRRIESLDPASDFVEIKQLFSYDFQSCFIVQAASGFMFTFAAPTMSRVLHATGQAGKHTAKRFVDTSLLTSAVINNGLEPGDGREAAKRVNAMHRQYDIRQDDFIAVGCESPLTALDLAERLGWRDVTDIERQALRNYHNAEARAFGSHKPIPETIAEMEDFYEHYLDTQLAFEPQNKELTDAVLGLVPQFVPAPMRPFINPILTAQIDPRILRACGLPAPSRLRKKISTSLLRAIAKADPIPDGVSGSNPIKTFADDIYPNGWTIQSLGTHIRSHTAAGSPHEHSAAADPHHSARATPTSQETT